MTEPTPLPGGAEEYELPTDMPPASGSFAPDHVELTLDDALAGEALGASIDVDDDNDAGL